ncbi:MAG: transglycosylase SLT domain-containing protein [Candidatus Binatia bacterium]
MRSFEIAAASAYLLVSLLCGGCLQDASRRPPSPTPPLPVPAAPRDARAARATFVDAVARYERGDLEGARPLFGTLLRSYPALEDYHLAYLAALEDRTGHAREASGLDDRLLATHPASVWVPGALARRARTALALGDARAEEIAERARAATDDDVAARDEALMVLATIRSSSRPREAYELYQSVRRNGGKSSATARTASTALEAAHPELLNDATLLIAEGRLLAAEDRTALAIERLQAAIAATTGAERIDALRALAKTYQQSGRLEDAFATYRTAVAAGPTSSMARFELASLLWNRDRDAEAKTLFTQIVAETPRHAKYDTARYALGRIAEQDGRADEAVAQFHRLAEEGGEGDLAREARWRLAWMPYRRGDLGAAEQAFVALGAGSSKDVVAAQYWRGRVLARRGLDAESRAELANVLSQAPDGYYGELAEQRVGTAPPSPDAPTPLAVAPPPSVTLHDYHWTRSGELRAAGLNGAAARELAALTRELPDGGEREPFLLEAYTDVEAHGRALRLAGRLGSGTLAPTTLAAYQYPRAYWSRVTAAADAARLDPYVVVALMRQESLFDPDAVSPAAAYGLMQLLPSTASRVAGTTMEPRQLFDPTTNIGLGTRYLRQLLDRYDGNLAKALAAYNGGEEAVAKWERRTPGAATDEFVETISYRETRHYVKQVLGNYRRYRRLYGAPGEQRALDRAEADPYDGMRDSSSAAMSVPASPPNPPFDINTTTSPDAT